MSDQEILEGVAIVGMAGRFPGAGSIEQFWRNLCGGVESIRFLAPAEDRALARDPALRDNPQYVPAGGFLEGVELFDAAFFGYNAREAQIMDPQQRLFLECAWEALERAGYDSQQYGGRIGVYAGAGMNAYLLDHVYPNRDLLGAVGGFQTMLSSEKDFLATRVSYKLGLRGPSITVQTACSTSLVAISLASQSLLGYQCDMALAGGVSLLALEQEGYLYEQGGIASPDGHVRAFDAAAQGTVGGSGLGIVVLKRLEDALSDGDTIYAVIRGAALNNDGDAKMGYTAPSASGQAEVIAEAIAVAGVEPETIGYVEAHGTGTALGDPIEVAALTEAFRAGTDRKGFCAIGSVKTNIGHLDAAAGVTGVIKASLALQHRLLPPSLHFSQPNPQIDFANSPFYVNTQLTAWLDGPHPRRAGVSSFGIGGTNAHVVLEEPPVAAASDVGRPAELLVLSARTSVALEEATTNLVEHLKAHPELNLADVAYTLQAGRRTFGHRRMVVCESREDAIASLAARDPRKVFTAVKEPGDRSLVFLFPGQGAQHANMGRQLYETEPVYRECVDYCCELLIPRLGVDLRDLLYPGSYGESVVSGPLSVAADHRPPTTQHATRNTQHATRNTQHATSGEDNGQRTTDHGQLDETSLAQPALFIAEYAMARLLESCGIRPDAMIGHSLGEYVAACIAGVLSLEDALFLVAERGRLMQAMPKGAMLSVSLPAEQVQPMLDEQLSLAVVFGPSLSVVGGTEEAVAALAERLAAQGIEHRHLHTSHAFHSPMMDPMLEPFCQAVASITLHPPSIPYVSCATGTWITDEEALDPTYWARHVRDTVRLSDGLRTLLDEPGRILVEVGPVQTLKALLKQMSHESARAIISVPAMRHPLDSQPDGVVLLNAVGKLWLQGLATGLAGMHAGRRRRRVVLPTYPFERRRYWIAASKGAAVREAAGPLLIDEPLDIPTEQVAEPAAFRSDLMSEYVEPRSATERSVAAIWQTFLGGEAIGVYDNFFELGGHSLLAIGLMARLRETFQVELSERTIYEQPTVAALAEAIDHSGQALDAIVPTTREGPIPASWHQERRWVRDQLHPDQVHNNNLSIGWELHGHLDAALFERAINEVVQRHEAMRTSFVEVDGQVLQVIAPQLTVVVPLVDLTHLPEAERLDEMLRLAAQQERSPFDMRIAPLWGLTLYRLAQDRYAWTIVAHQSIWDGVSAHTVQYEVGVILEGLLAGKDWELPALPVQFADIAQWEHRRFQGELLEGHMSYWRRKLAGDLAPIDLPTDRPRVKEFAPSALHERNLPRSLADRLKALGQEQGATLYMTMVAAFKTLCHAYSGQADILVESSFPNRDRPELETLVAPLVNMVTLRTSLAGDPSFREMLGRVRETVTGAIAHRELPFVAALKELRPEYYTRHDRLGRVFVAQYSAEGGHPPLPGVTYGQRLWFRRSMPDIYMAIVDYEEYVEVAWEYSSHLFDAATIARMFDDYTALLEQIAANPDQQLTELAFGVLQGSQHDRLIATY